MPKQIRLKDQNNAPVIIQEGESLNIVATFADVSASPETLTLADLLTLKVTLYAGTTVINSRDAQDIKNTNGGTVTAAGALTLALTTDDNPIVNNTLTAGETEEHIARLEWTWNDGTTRKGIVEYIYEVEKLASPT